MSMRITTRKMSTVEYTTADDTITIDVTIDCLDDGDHAYLAITKQSNEHVAMTYKCKRDEILKSINVVTRGYYGSYFAPAVKCITGEMVKIEFERVGNDFFNVSIDDINLSMTRQQMITFSRCFDRGC